MLSQTDVECKLGFLPKAASPVGSLYTETICEMKSGGDAVADKRVARIFSFWGGGGGGRILSPYLSPLSLSLSLSLPLPLFFLAFFWGGGATAPLATRLVADPEGVQQTPPSKFWSILFLKSNFALECV